MFSERKFASAHASLVRVILMLSVLLGVPVSSTLFGGSLQRQVYSDLDGTLLSDLLNAPTYPDQPDEVSDVAQFESPLDSGDRYGQRIHGYLVPPLTGNYLFGIASDDQGALYLSSDETPANAREIASVLTWTSFREWAKEPNQESAPVFLQAGRLYYVSALMKEFFGGDHVSVRWVRPDGIEEGPIPGDYLLPFGVAIHEPSVTRPPSDTTVVEGEMANFRVEWDPLGPADLQWQKNGADIPGATGATLQLGPITLAESGTRVRVILRNSQGEAISREAVMTVTPDTVSPRPIAAFNEGPRRIRIRWSERLAPDGASDVTNYTLNPDASIVSAALADDPREIVLETVGVMMGIEYRLTIKGLFDRATTPNPVASGAQVSFTASEFSPASVGTNQLNGSIIRTNGGFDISSRGSGLAGSSDEVQFAWQKVSGDFDMEVRVARLESAAAWGQAGLIARTDSSADAPFGAAIASSVQVGCVFKARTVLGGNVLTRCQPGHFAVNYPQTWLRLKRAGDLLTGYGSLDANSWTELGRAQLPNLPMEIEVGLTVASVNATRNSVGHFRDYGATRQTAVATPLKRREPLGPSSRATGMVISEIMYHPAPRTDALNLEYVELYNAGTVFQNLAGWRLSGAIEFQFPNPFIIEAGEFLVVAADPAGLAAVYGLQRVLGPFSNRLENGNGVLRLRNEQNAVMLEAAYSSGSHWPAAADGAGHSLVLGRPSYGERDRRAWIASARVGGSPGENDAIYPSAFDAVVINEFLANSEEPMLDFVELYNHGSTPVDLGGCQLSDTAGSYRFRIPEGTQIAAGGYVVFDENQLGFRLEADGESLFMGSPDGTHIIDAIHFDGQVQNVSAGRWPDGASEIRPLAQPTPGNRNASWRQAPVVINEIMYHPPGGLEDGEFIEIYNPGTSPIALDGWRIEGGIEFEFTPNTQISAGAFLVIAKNRENLVSHYPQLAPAKVVGNFSGSLRNSGDRIALAMPQLQTAATNTTGQPLVEKFYAVISEVDYRDGGQWGRWADGGGSSLELIDPRADPMRGSNWADSDESKKGEWRSFELTGRLDNGNFSFPPSQSDFPIAPEPQLQIILQEAGEALVDDVQVESADGMALLQNGGFESNADNWVFQGNHETSRVESGVGSDGSSGLHIIAFDRGDTGYNRIRAKLEEGLEPDAVGKIRLKARWLRGSPHLLSRIRGGWLEAPFDLVIPQNLGTPGLPNSRGTENAPPAIYEVEPFPILPAVGEKVMIRARAVDPDAVTEVTLHVRVDPSIQSSSLSMRDDGQEGDEVAGDGLYTATLEGRGAQESVAFHISATDGKDALGMFPYGAPVHECLVRWGETQPVGTLGHYHMWTTAATDLARANSSALNNTLRDTTLVYGAHRIVYGAAFKDKGSPFHGGGGDLTVVVPPDDSLLGARDLLFSATGNGGNESTQLREQLSFWIAGRLGLPHLYRRYVHVYYNGVEYRNVNEDAEEPDGDFAERWFRGEDGGDLYKIEDWFEFLDDGINFSNQDATLQPFLTTNDQLKLARYRWSWRKRSVETSPNDYTNIFALVEAANSSEPSFPESIEAIADIDEWMRHFALQRICGNWDSYGFARGKNAYLYRPESDRFRIIPWDIDFTLGTGNGPTDGLWGANDPTIERLYEVPVFRRMLWRAYQDAIEGPLLQSQFEPEIQARYQALRNNELPELGGPGAVVSYLNARREYIQGELKAADAPSFAITSPQSGLTVSQASVSLQGTAPFVVATILVNGTPLPIEWTDYTQWQITAPLFAATNRLEVLGLDNKGSVVPGALGQVSIRYSGPVTNPPAPEINVLISEVMAGNTRTLADPSDGSFDDWFELYNAGSQSVDLSGYGLTDSLDDPFRFVVPTGFVIAPNSVRLIWADDESEQNENPGADLHVSFRLSVGGEDLALFKPDGTLVDAVHFGPQSDDVSIGRKSTDAQESLVAMARPTPGALNAAVATGIEALFGLKEGQIEVSWRSVPGTRYRVEFSDALSPGNWRAFGELTATGSTQTFMDSLFEEARFYRIVVVP